MNPYDAASPLDARYYFSEPAFYGRLHPYVSEVAQITYLARVEAALVDTLADHGVCPRSVALEVQDAVERITPEEVYEEERRIQHNIRALVNCIRNKVSPEARPFVHLFATSADIVDTAKALSLRDVNTNVVVPDLKNLLKQLIALAKEHAATKQMGRTHGQHAVPITFGFAVALYVSRLGQRIETVIAAAKNLRGKFAGAVGAYNALALLRPKNPETVEADLMKKLGLLAPEISSQVVQPEYVTDYIYALASCWGVLANLADDFRHLQRSEIRELTDRKASDPNTQVVGSSTMPHKINPKDFENVKSLWKAYIPRIQTLFMDQISEHQRDLTNSASGRFVTEFVTAFAYGVFRTAGAVASIEPDKVRMKELLDGGKDPVAAEPLYVLLSLYGHADGHEQARVLARQARVEGKTLSDVLHDDASIREYLDRFTPEQQAVLADPANYCGAAEARTLAICEYWLQRW